MKNAVIIHLPHSSIKIPDDVRKDILLTDNELKKELLTITDSYTDELFSFEDAITVKNVYSRLVFDPERFRNESDEVMAKFGMGAVYTSTTDGKTMRNLTPQKIEEMLKRFYDPYHRTLQEEADNLLLLYGKCLLIDGHSFPENPLPFELDQNPDRPDICIGTCDFHTPERLVTSIEAYIKSHGMSVKRNSPFMGTMVPTKFYMKDARVSSIMIEVNRRLYMNEVSGEKLPGFHEVRQFIESLMLKLMQEFSNG